jgi:tripartite ATP-independent transporter DctP family solute receptor
MARALGLTALLAAGLIAGAAHAETLRIAGNFPSDHSSSRAMERFKSLVEERSAGELTVDLFPDMQLGGAQENVDQVVSGTIFGTWIGIAYLSRTVPELEAVSLPFVFADRETAFQVMDGRVGELLDEKLAAKGYASLGYMELGLRHVTNNVRPILERKDFQGLKLRMQPNETHIATFRAIGANPVAMGISEVYQALQQGVLDGQENPYAVIATRRFDEVQKYLSDSAHFFDFVILIANKDAMDGLSPEKQEIVRAAAAEAIAWQRDTAAAEDEAAKAALIERGMQFDHIPDETRTELREATKDIVDQVRERAGDEVVDAVLSEAGA